MNTTLHYLHKAYRRDKASDAKKLKCANSSERGHKNSIKKVVGRIQLFGLVGACNPKETGGAHSLGCVRVGQMTRCQHSWTIQRLPTQTRIASFLCAISSINCRARCTQPHTLSMCTKCLKDALVRATLSFQFLRWRRAQ